MVGKNRRLGQDAKRKSVLLLETESQTSSPYQIPVLIESTQFITRKSNNY
jgi:hypothetical protein